VRQNHPFPYYFSLQIRGHQRARAWLAGEPYKTQRHLFTLASQYCPDANWSLPEVPVEAVTLAKRYLGMGVQYRLFFSFLKYRGGFP
jgi:hypothetical protein